MPQAERSVALPLVWGRWEALTMAWGGIHAMVVIDEATRIINFTLYETLILRFWLRGDLVGCIVDVPTKLLSRGNRLGTIHLH